MLTPYGRRGGRWGCGGAPRRAAPPPAPGPAAPPGPGGEPPAALVTVRRTGGFIGRGTDAQVDLDADPRGPELRDLVDRIDLGAVPGGDPHPDMYVYDLDLCGARATVPEQHLTQDLRRLVD